MPERNSRSLLSLLGVGVLSVYVGSVAAQTSPTSTAASTTAAEPAPPVEEKPNLGEVSAKNPFDPKRQMWVEKPPPPPPPPPPPTLTPNDVVLYGVVQVGNLKKAYVRLSHVLAGSLPQPKEGRAHELTVGQQLGPFYAVQEIAADRLVLAAPGVTYTATFGKKTDRPAPLPVAPPSQAAVELARPTPTFVPDPSTQPAVGSAPAMPAGSPPGAPAAGTAVVGTTPPTTTAAPAPAPPQVSGRTLLEAIEAARAAQQAGLMPASPPNPFAGK